MTAKEKASAAASPAAAKDDTETVYSINTAFAHEHVWYTRENERELANLPADVLKAKVASGAITKSVVSRKLAAEAVINQEASTTIPYMLSRGEPARHPGDTGTPITE